MARLSKNSLSPEQEDDLIIQLASALEKMNRGAAEHFIFEFLGKEEKIMLAKRLAIIALINEGRPVHKISTHLHVSETTVSNLKLRYDQNRFKHTLKVLTGNKTDYKKFVDILDSILTVGGIMPHRNYIIHKKK